MPTAIGPTMLALGPAAKFAGSHRYVVSWRSYRDPSLYASTLLYRSPDLPVNSADKGKGKQKAEWWGITNECPHLNAPLEQGQIVNDEDDIEDLEPTQVPVILCPFHAFDFDLSSGHSSTGLKACTYKVEEREDGQLHVEPPGLAGDDFRVLGIREVSERFATDELTTPTPTFDLSAPPPSLVSFCRLILLTPDPVEKVNLVRHLCRVFRSGQLPISTPSVRDPHTDAHVPSELPPPDTPARSDLLKVVKPGQMHRLGKGGTVETRVRAYHSLACIELWAIDLAIDAMARFWDWRLGSTDGKSGKRLGMRFFSDFLKVAEDEAKHFTLLRERLEELGCTYGELPVHNGLWESATETADSLFSRLAIIHLVHEARGLDTNPKQIARASSAGDKKSAAMLQIIHDDEITHVATGHRHFQILCAAHDPPLDPVATFRQEVKLHFYGALKGPFNVADREKGGMGREWFENLGGRGYASKLQGVVGAQEPVKAAGGREAVGTGGGDGGVGGLTEKVMGLEV